MAALLLSRAGLASLAIAIVVGVLLTQTGRLAHTKASLSRARAALAAAEASLKASESLRTAERAEANEALSQAEIACAARIAEARRSADNIRILMEKPHATDRKTGCPVRALLGSDELRDALQPTA